MSDISALIAANAGYIVGLLVFVASTSVAFLVMSAARNRSTVRRRAAGISADQLDSAGNRSLAGSGKKMAQRLIDRTTKHYSSIDDKNLKLLRQRLVQAGIFNPRAIGFFFLVRAVLAIVLGTATFLAIPALVTLDSSTEWAVAGVGGLFGYLGPQPRSRSHHQGPAAGISRRISGLHGSPGGLRRCRPRHHRRLGAGRP